MACILIIDDEPTVLESIAVLLHLHGWRTQVAENGREGLDKARPELPDLVLCDVNMPVMDGLEFLTEVRNDPVLKSVPVLMITGRAGVEEHPALRRGARAVLLKPFDTGELIAQIRVHLDARSHRASLLNQLHAGKRVWTTEELPGHDAALFQATVLNPLRQLRDDGVVGELEVQVRWQDGAPAGYRVVAEWATPVGAP